MWCKNVSYVVNIGVLGINLFQTKVYYYYQEGKLQIILKNLSDLLVMVCHWSDSYIHNRVDRRFLENDGSYHRISTQDGLDFGR